MTAGHARAAQALGTAQGFAHVGDPHAALLAGPPADAGPETLDAHQQRLGALPLPPDDALLTEIADSGLVGRGGGGFPLARKVQAVIAAVRAGRGQPIVVVNASESEPASRKDATLLELRPHLVLDGAAAAARAVGADEVVVHLHRGARDAIAGLTLALTERAHQHLDDPHWRVSLGPDRYVAGESSAVVAHVEGGEARPRFTERPLAEAGVHGRPTLLNNAETLAHLALIVRHGAQDWRTTGPSPWSGPTLVTLAGAVTQPGTVVEITGRVTIGELLCRVGGVTTSPAGVLIGGYAGHWLPGRAAWNILVDRASMTAAGAAPGCGLIAVLPDGVCGVAETARLVGWLAVEGAQQCGPCIFALPALAAVLSDLADGRAGRRAVKHLDRLTADVDGRGACRHPDGVVGLVRSAVQTFADDVARHRSGQRCAGSQRGLLPLPPPGRGWR
jgi:NADH:ubiquinone oxidoreductase subunit F (NADH-binding)